MIQTHIQWTDATVNFWTGCSKVSDGCKYCYMFRDKERYGQDPTVVLKTKDATFRAALKWKEGKKIFTNSWSDFFIEQADEWREEAWQVIKNTQQHTWQILTKRPERILQCLPADWGDGYPNVWIGVSVETEKYMHRVYTLADIPAKVRFISAEPLLEQIDFYKYADVLKRFDWVIVGGESGNDKGKYGYRECKLEWIEKIISDLAPLQPKVFVKQLGTSLAKQMKLKDRHGGNIEEWPVHLQIREFPKETETNFSKTLINSYE